MTTYTAEQVMTATPVVPVIVVDDVEQAVNLGKALVAGGVPVLEVTMRTEAALAAITALRQQVPDAIVGAGTVCNREQYIAAVEAGAQFIISPGATPDLLTVGKEYDIPYAEYLGSKTLTGKVRDKKIYRLFCGRTIYLMDDEFLKRFFKRNVAHVEEEFSPKSRIK